jgi:excisionase family DNA binding protein
VEYESDQMRVVPDLFGHGRPQSLLRGRCGLASDFAADSTLRTDDRAHCRMESVMQDAVKLKAGQPQRLFVVDALSGPEVFVTASEAGDFLELHPATVQRFAREGLIPAHPVAGEKRRRWRFLRSELAEWLRARTGEKRISA